MQQENAICTTIAIFIMVLNSLKSYCVRFLHFSEIYSAKEVKEKKLHKKDLAHRVIFYLSTKREKFVSFLTMEMVVCWQQFKGPARCKYYILLPLLTENLINTSIFKGIFLLIPAYTSACTIIPETLFSSFNVEIITRICLWFDASYKSIVWYRI